MAIKIYTIWVGQGDCTLIQTDTNKLILIDCGTSDNQKIYEDNVKPSIENILKGLGKASIDYLIITHSDKDHCNLISKLFAFTTFDVAYFGGLPNQYDYDLELDPAKHNPEIKKIVQLAPYRFDILVNAIIDDGDFKAWIVSGNYPFKGLPVGVKMDVDINKKRKRTDRNKKENKVFDINGNSLILVIYYKGFQAFFLGDATIHQQETLYKKAEEANRLANFKADMMKMSHHGSPDSMSTELTNKAIKPQIATASAGVTFGHPSQQAIVSIADLTKTGAGKHNVVEYDKPNETYLKLEDVVEYIYGTMQTFEQSSIEVPTEGKSGKKSHKPHAGELYLEMKGGNWVFEVSGPGVPTITSAKLEGILTTKGTTAVNDKKRRKRKLIRLVSNARFVGGRWVEPDAVHGRTE